MNREFHFKGMQEMTLAEQKQTDGGILQPLFIAGCILLGIVSGCAVTVKK